MQQIMTATPYLHYIKLRSCIPIITSFFGKTVINLKLIAKVPQNTHKNSSSGAALWIKVTFLTNDGRKKAAELKIEERGKEKKEIEFLREKKLFVVHPIK